MLKIAKALAENSDAIFADEPKQYILLLTKVMIILINL
jgi:ABC-type cobalamin/Fe3+-siderophores transport system ATPase subunit